MNFLITSVHNIKIKNLLALQQSRKRKQKKLLVIEGIKELSHALEEKYVLTHVFFCAEIVHEKILCDKGLSKEILIPVTKSIFEKIAYRKTTGGVVATAMWKTHLLDDLSVSKKSLFLVLTSIEKPGNLGALLRTSDAAGIDAVIICDPHTDIYNSNVIRSSIGCVFTNRVVVTTSENTIAWLKKNKIKMYSTSLEATIPYYKVDYTPSCALIIGSESTGLDEIWKREAQQNIIIPMHGKTDSMNVSVTAGIIIFEALRQREEQKIMTQKF